MDEAAMDSAPLSRRLVILAFFRKGIVGASNLHSVFSVDLGAAALGVVLLLAFFMLSALSEGVDNGDSFIFDGEDNDCIAAPPRDMIYV